MTLTHRWSLLAGLAVLLAGCSGIPPGGDPAQDPGVLALAASGEAPFGRLALAPVTTVTLADDEAAKGWRASDAALLEPGPVRELLARALVASGRWDRVRLAGREAGDAWRERDDFVLSVAIEAVRTRFDGHNRWWIPNLFNFFLNTPFAWFVATEEYTLSLAARLTLTSVGSGGVLVERTVPVEVHGTFDEFDRGWQLLGPISPRLDAETWRGIAGQLLPEAVRVLAVATAVAPAQELAALRRDERLAPLVRKTLVLAVGVATYQDARAFPPAPFARDDALAVGAAFVTLTGRPAQVLTRVDGQATLSGVQAALLTHLGRAREDDLSVVYFAGYGRAGADGRPELVLHDTGAGGGLPLHELARSLAALPGRKLLIVDAGFAGRGRSVAGVASWRGAFAAAPGVALVLAAGPDESALAPEHLASGLLTHHLLRGLERLALRATPEEGELDEVLAGAARSVAEEAELLGGRQRPLLFGAERLQVPRGAPGPARSAGELVP